jgi:hypothetical protein
VAAVTGQGCALAECRCPPEQHMSGPSPVFAPISAVALLENGIEDEKASAGKHRALGRSAHVSSSLAAWSGPCVRCLFTRNFNAFPFGGACQSAEG